MQKKNRRYEKPSSDWWPHALWEDWLVGLSWILYSLDLDIKRLGSNPWRWAFFLAFWAVELIDLTREPGPEFWLLTVLVMHFLEFRRSAKDSSRISN